MKMCNGQGCNGAWDCDTCRTQSECERWVECDECGVECDTYYTIDGKDYCEECVDNLYKNEVY